MSAGAGSIRTCASRSAAASVAVSTVPPWALSRVTA
jgi:hypothetical protein